MKKKAIILLTVVSLITVLLTAIHQPKAEVRQIIASQPQQNACCAKENFGAIEGQVYDPSYHPVAGARVYAERLDAIMTRLFYSLSDGEGKFLIEELPPGIYKLYGAKEEDGYARTTSRFYYKDDMPLPQVAVQKEQITSNIIVTLRPKAAQLVLHIVNAKTNKLLKSARITLREANAPDHSYSSSRNNYVAGDFMILAPPVPFTIEVSAPNYQDWHYVGPDKASNSLKLASGKSAKIIVALQPAK